MRLSQSFFLVSFCLCSAEVQAGGWADWWATPDQQGQRLFDQGDFAGAVEAFVIPGLRASAFYRAGDFETARRGRRVGQQPLRSLGHRQRPNGLSVYRHRQSGQGRRRSGGTERKPDERLGRNGRTADADTDPDLRNLKGPP